MSNGISKAKMQFSELAEYFQESLCILDLKAGDKHSALEEMVDLISSEYRLKNKEIILEMLLNRESLGSTALGKGVAFPHGRTLAIPELTLLFACSKEGIDFEDNLYLQVLGHLVELIRDANMRKRLMQVRSFSELQEIIGS
jgi:mannitol/fructose-specific phosphotransferase system IIA component (Ntr-type)